ncbi:unnamed protein product, partial [Amoebophrya sp. A120]
KKSVFEFDREGRAFCRYSCHTSFHIECKNVWIWKVSTCNAVCGFQKNLCCMPQQEEPSLCSAERAFLMQNRHHEALEKLKSAMLRHALQVSLVLLSSREQQGRTP